MHAPHARTCRNLKLIITLKGGNYMAWALDGKQSIYSQLVEIILKKIITGVYAPGARMESVRDLASEAGVNPNTMQRALAELERLGIISTQRTSGKFITEDQDMIESIRAQMAKEAIQKLMSDMKEIGFDKEEILALIKQSADTEENAKEEEKK